MKLKALQERGQNGWSAWSRFWFTPADARPLAAMRIGTCGILLFSYLMALPGWSEHYGPAGWIDQPAVQSIQALGEFGLSSTWSLWMLTDSDFLLRVGYGVFLLLLVCGMAGCGTRWVLPAVWIGHVSFVHRGMIYLYGVDLIAGMLLLYLAISPSGSHWSWDHWRKTRRGEPDDGSSAMANVALRCIQIHLCVVYASAGLSKLAGPKWWSGTAVWYAVMTPEMWSFSISPAWLFGPGFVGGAFLNLATHATLVLEIGFPFLIWNHRLRPLLLVTIVLMHLGTGLMMGLGSFAAIMSIALLAFAPQTAFVRLTGILVKGFRLQGLERGSHHADSADRVKQAA